MAIYLKTPFSYFLVPYNKNNATFQNYVTEYFRLLIIYQRFALSPTFSGSTSILKHFTLIALRLKIQGLSPKFFKITFGNLEIKFWKFGN